MKVNPQPPIETLTGSSCPAPNSSRESAKALTPVDASPKTPLKQKKNWNLNKMRLHIKLPRREGNRQ